MGLDESKLNDQAGWLIVKEIEKLLEESVEEKTDEKDKEKLLKEFLDAIIGKPPALEGEDTSENKSTITELEAELEKIKIKHEAEIKEALNKVEAAKIEIKNANSGNDAKSEQSNMDHLKTILKRELRIVGTISTPGQKDQVSYISLNRQIEAALEKGYSIREIVDAVIRSISPSLPLRSYLEAISELTLPTLHRIIRAHYQEKNRSELYAELANLAQISTEEPQTFLIRALNLREKIIYASKEANTKLKYDPEHVQSMFLHTIETGLISNTLRGRIRPLLQNVAISDEELISQLILAVTEEAERSKKLAASSAKVKVKVSQVEQIKANQIEKSEKPQEEMIAEMKTLKAKVALPEREVKENQVTQKNASNRPRFQGNRKGCPACASAGVGDTSRHCWKCGSDSHFSFDCPKRNHKNQENGQSLLGRDPQ